MIKDKNFGKMLRELRESKGITLDLLCLGLCDVGKLSRIENAKVEADKNLRDRLLTRLGVAEENYENFLYYSEYKGWKDRQNIVHGILQGRLEEAKQLLETYRINYSLEQSLEQQFYLSMQTQIQIIEGAEAEKSRELFRKALLLTVPEEIIREPWNGLLSVEELNLLLEYAFYCKETFSEQWYERLFDVVENHGFDALAMTKIYPKLVVYFYDAFGRKEASKAELGKWLKSCDKAIEILQQGNRMIYLWELLDMKEQVLQCLLEKNAENGETAVKKLKGWQETCIKWKTTLAELYEEYDVTKETRDFCYIYVDGEVHCIGDVIRIRRKMFGMTMQQLSDGICSERTISRLERNETEPQREIVRLLFDRLNMPAEFCRKEIVTENPKVLRLLGEARYACNERKFDTSDELLEQIKEMVSFDIPGNAQVIRRIHLMNESHRKKAQGQEVDKQEYVNKLKEIMEETVPYEVAVSPGEKYLTKNEIGCLPNMMTHSNWNQPEMKECVETMYRLFEEQRKPEECFDAYEFVMGNVASKLGNRGDYDLSDEIGEKIIRYGLLYRRPGVLAKEIYSLLWNDAQRQKNQHLPKRGADTKKELIKCICLCEISGDFYYGPFFRNVLENGIN